MTDLVPMAWKEERKRLWHPSMLCVGSIFPTGRFTGKFLDSKYGISAQIRRLDHAAQGFSQIWRDRMPVVQSVFRHNKFAVGIKHNEVSIAARGDVTFVRIATSKAS